MAEENYISKDLRILEADVEFTLDLLACGSIARGNIKAIVIQQKSKQKVPLKMEAEMKNFVKLISILSILIGAACFAIAMIVQKQSFLGALVVLISVIVANIPEGSLLAITV